MAVEAKAIHGMYSGAEVFTMIEAPQAVKAQNRLSLPLPGELLYFYDDGVGGVGVMLKGHEGAAASASLFARIPGNWKHDWVAIAQACRRRWEAPQRLRIEVGLNLDSSVVIAAERKGLTGRERGNGRAARRGVGPAWFSGFYR